MRWRRVAGMAVLGVTLGWLLARVPALGPGPPAPVSAVLPAPAPPPASAPGSEATGPAAAPEDRGRLHVLALNGGGSAPQNFQSHLIHVSTLVRLLRAARVPAERIALFSGDGEDPAPDLAVREVPPEADLRLLEGTRFEATFRTPVQLVSSRVEGFRLFPATRGALAIWFLTARSQLRAGDTLLLYVTDHGTRDPADREGSRITLWGGEDLSTRELGEMLDGLDPGVRVVAVMSQCFSGGFASLWDRGDRPGCGFFSTTRNRMAYGCYPENRGRENVGHSFLFLRALQASGHLGEAHAETLVSDATPDVPLRTSNRSLARLLGEAAESGRQAVGTAVDQTLAEVWAAPERWADEAALLDQVADRFGMPGPSAIATLELAVRRLEEVAGSLKGEADRSRQAVGALATANLDRFLRTQPQWQPVVEGGRAGNPPAVVGAMVASLAAFTGASDTGARLRGAREEAERLAALAYRTEVRLAAALRLRVLLTRLAGRAYLATRGTEAERQRFAVLQRCEQTALPAVPALPAEPAASERFPTWDEDEALARSLPRALQARLQAARAAAPPLEPGDDLVAYRGVLPAALAGQRRLLAFWATWCKPCQRELPVLAAFARTHAIPLVAVTDEPADQLTEFFQRAPAALPDNVAIDGARQLFRRFEVTALPTVVALDADGTIATRTTGYQPPAYFGLPPPP